MTKPKPKYKVNPIYTKYAEHEGHLIECVFYGADGDGDSVHPEEVAIECVDCNVVLTSEYRLDKP